MNKTIKTFAILAALAVFGTSGIFAQTDTVAATEVKTVSSYDGAKTVAVSVKVKNKKDGQHIILKLKNKKTFEAKAFNDEGTEAIEKLLQRDGKKAVISGFIDESTGVIKVIKIGGLVEPENVDEK